jgi:hypothetical protein
MQADELRGWQTSSTQATTTPGAGVRSNLVRLGLLHAVAQFLLRHRPQLARLRRVLPCAIATQKRRFATKKRAKVHERAWDLNAQHFILERGSFRQ